MRCSCYEIGGDVFSLAELQCCIIRGKMSPAVSAKPPYVEEPKGSQGHRFYALGIADTRTNFILVRLFVFCFTNKATRSTSQ
mmetsp:Transcript_20747/g.30364  ORF Transcript_20747/g.30364 Transcript_20747/m.30364 type:complete len:82 (+) Transcript_20747:2515-2760(+)